MTDDIEAHVTMAREAAAEGRAGDARNAWARAAALSRESGAPLLQAHALRHLSDLDRMAGHPEQALAHAEQAAALYAVHGQAASPDRANSLRLRALALDDMRRPDQATAVWIEARDIYAALGIAAGAAECETRIDGAAISSRAVW